MLRSGGILFIAIFCLYEANAQNFGSYSQTSNNQQGSSIYKIMPLRGPMKVKVFLACRQECSNKCNHSLFAYATNKNECYTCLLECMAAFTEQAEKITMERSDRPMDENSINKLNEMIFGNTGGVTVTPQNNLQFRRRMRRNYPFTTTAEVH